MKVKVKINASQSIKIISDKKILSKEEQNRTLTLYEKYQKIPSLMDQGLTNSQICNHLNMDIRIYNKLVALTAVEISTYFNTVNEERSTQKLLVKLERVKEVIQLKESGNSIRQIADLTGLSRQTISKYLQPQFNPTHASTGVRRSSVLDPYLEFITSELEKGIIVRVIEKKIRTMGYHSSSSTVRNYCSNWKKNKNKSQTLHQKIEDITIETELLDRKNIIKLLYYPIDKVKGITQEQFEQLLIEIPKFRDVHNAIWKFKNLVSNKQIEVLSGWIDETRKLCINELNSFINGIERDIEAVKNAIIYDYSNGLAEGSVNKLKVIKRIMYGRCGFDTLRSKTLRLEIMRKIN